LADDGDDYRDLKGNSRLPSDATSVGGADVTVIADGGEPPEFNEATGTMQVPLPDGSVQISWGQSEDQRTTAEFDDNLALSLDEAQLSTIAERILMGIEQDIQTRSAWLENMSNGISLLGLEIKNPRGAAASGATPQEGTSTVDHPLLLEAVLRFQANARGELLPSDGPVKVRNDGEPDSLADRLAEALEKDMNHYLTKVAKEYYPDTDRMLLMLGFCGMAFKKGSHHPIKRRPVIESIDAKDLIVSNAATDIDRAGRVTHRVWMTPSIMKRMQLLGAYRDIHLPSPGTPSIKDPVDQKIDQVQGIAPPTYTEPNDQDRELYECYCEIEVPGFEHKIDGKASGLPLPYKVTLDKEARRILEIRRNWAEDDELCMPKNRIVAYIFVPGLGFYGIGLLNILGNATKAVTAAWRLMLDAGMFANFPGFLYLKSLAKQLTNQFRIPPGGGMPIDTVGNDIRASIMPLPYKGADPSFIQLIENVVETAQRVGGTAELQVGEGRADAPVGTTLAMIEQATKLISAVHKRLHQAQGAEFSMLKELLMEDPTALWRHNKKSEVLKMLVAQSGQQPVVDDEVEAEDRHRDLFLAALSDCELVPAADPNTSSQTERYLKIMAIRQMAMTPGSNLDLNKVDEFIFHSIGMDDWDDFQKPLADPNAPPPPPSPEQMTAFATLQAAQARITEANTKAQDSQIKAQSSVQEMQTDATTKAAELASKEKIAALQVSREMIIHQSDQDAAAAEAARDDQNRAADRVHKLALASTQARANAQQAALDRAHESQQGIASRSHEVQQTGLGLAHEAVQSHLDRQHEAGQGIQQIAEGGVARQHEALQSAADRQHESIQSAADRTHELVQEGLARQHEHQQNELDRENAIKTKPTAPTKPKGDK
jgi:hypothetical protein